MAELPTEIWDLKGAIRMLTRTLALELAEHSISVAMSSRSSGVRETVFQDCPSFARRPLKDAKA
ncbi:MAG: hypothetical protein H0X18_11315 [Geodermatophilaceae bacterium]|nr:hypothetical protein [Geodermatophilaceae bacterium]